jgi:hypothetical protein
MTTYYLIFYRESKNRPWSQWLGVEPSPFITTLEHSARAEVLRLSGWYPEVEFAVFECKEAAV